MLNLATQAGVLTEVDPGRVFDLAVDFFTGMPCFTAGGDPPFTMWMSATPSGMVLDDPLGVGEEQNRLLSRSADCMSMFLHTGTHVDALNHIGYGGTIFNGFTEAEHLGSRHWYRAGADRHPPVITRGVLLDVAALHGVDELPPSHAIGPADLEATLARQGRSCAAETWSSSGPAACARGPTRSASCPTSRGSTSTARGCSRSSGRRASTSSPSSGPA